MNRRELLTKMAAVGAVAVLPSYELLAIPPFQKPCLNPVLYHPIDIKQFADNPNVTRIDVYRCGPSDTDPAQLIASFAVIHYRHQRAEVISFSDYVDPKTIYGRKMWKSFGLGFREQALIERNG